MAGSSDIWNTLEAELPQQRAFLGFDGCVDSLYQVVQKRTGRGDAYVPYSTMSEFSERIGQAAGISCNVEIVSKQVKWGGNGPIMARALAHNRMPVTYLGPLGEKRIHPVFESLSESADIISLGDPAATFAMEFDDGKVMLANTTIYDEISPEQVMEAAGQARLRTILAEAQLVALLNWSCIPGLSEVLEALKSHLSPVSLDTPKQYFFDLADIGRREDEDICEVLRVIESYSEYGAVTLGLNHGEASDVLRVLGQSPQEELLRVTRQLHESLPSIRIAVHAVRQAAYADDEGAVIVEGPYCRKPMTTTGAGDHFNAGFSIGAVCGLAPELRLKLGVLFSGYYVCKGRTPTLRDVRGFASEKDFHL